MDFAAIRKNVNFQNFKIHFALLCKIVAMVILHQFLGAGHIVSNVTKQESYL